MTQALVKWFLTEPGSAAVADLLGPNAPLIVAPDLLLVEVTATFVRLVNQRGMSKEDGAQTIKTWGSAWRLGQVRSFRMDDISIARAAHLAIELGHPLKDCIYLALALDLGCPLLTAAPSSAIEPTRCIR